MSDEELNVDRVVDRTRREPTPHPQDVEILAREAKMQKARLEDEQRMNKAERHRIREALREIEQLIRDLEASMEPGSDDDSQ